VHFRNAFIDRLLVEGEEAAGATVDDYQRETAEKDREYDSTASALDGKRELNEDEPNRLKLLWKMLVRMFHPDLHGSAHAPRVWFSAPSLETGVCHVRRATGCRLPDSRQDIGAPERGHSARWR